MEHPMEEVTLKRGAWPEAMSQDAFLRALPDGVIAMVYSTSEAVLSAVVGGALTQAPQDPARIFEIRAFNERGEWRWLRDGRTGNAAWVGEGTVPNGCACTPKTVKREEISYLLEGELIKGNKLGSRRIGSYSIPFEPNGKHVVLKMYRYIGDGDDWGNQAVIEERCVKFDNATSFNGKKS